MNKLLTLLGGAVTAAGLLLALPQSAAAFPMPMRVIGKANPPIGHYEYCKTNAADCTPTSASTNVAPEVLDEEKWRTILDVNYTVNTEIQPETDEQIYGVEERWAMPTTVGDCEDYVLLKRRELIKRGFAPGNVLITVVLQPNGEGHAVLTVRTDRGEFILDNMRNKVLAWDETEYTYLKRQASDNPGRWVKLQDGRAGTVSTVKY